MKYKKAIAPLIPILIIGALALIGIGGGFLTALKINELINSIPTWLWWGLGILLILMMLPKKK